MAVVSDEAEWGDKASALRSTKEDKINKILELENRSLEAGGKYCDYSHMMNDKLRVWATNEADKLSKISKRKRDKFNTASIVYDKSTGKCYYGRNNGININGRSKNHILFGDSKHKGILPEKSFNRYAVGNCAEVDAVNNALNDGAKLENLYMSTIHTTKFNFGDLKSACENCTYTFKGRIIENYAGWFEGGN